MSLSPPVVVYPNTMTPPQPTSHSKGSFGPVFIVLAIIIVLSAIACCLGQICARRHKRSKPKKERQHVHPKDGGDIEFGFKKKVPAEKPVGYRDMKDSRPFQHGHGEMRDPRVFQNGHGEMRDTRAFQNGHGEMREQRPFQNGHGGMKEPKHFYDGEMKGEVRFGDNGEGKGSG
ncbi:hypothetical protein ACHQM5_007139 [Ranunculus cassubicifolius]